MLTLGRRVRRKTFVLSGFPVGAGFFLKRAAASRLRLQRDMLYYILRQ